MHNPSAPPSRSLDLDASESVNAARYCNLNYRLRLNAKGQTVAVRRVVGIGQPGSFATQRYQAVTPRGIVRLSHSSLSAWEEQRSHPVN